MVNFIVKFDRVQYVAYDGPDHLHGYRFTYVKSEAVKFSSQALALDFCDAGPKWAVDLTKRGLLTVVSL